jgi:protein farnesyltransferase subunit beta
VLPAGIARCRRRRYENDANNPLLSPAIPRHIASCQTHEGGFGAELHNEAHGGYTFCALASLRILGALSAIDADAMRS